MKITDDDLEAVNYALDFISANFDGVDLDKLPPMQEAHTKLYCFSQKIKATAEKQEEAKIRRMANRLTDKIFNKNK